MRLLRVLAAALAMVLVAGACDGDEGTEAEETTTTEAPTTTTFDEAAARAEIEAAFATFVNDELPTEQNVAVVEDGENLIETYDAVEAANPDAPSVTAKVDSIAFTSSTTADVTYSLFPVGPEGGQPLVANLAGGAILIEGKWKVTRATVCDLFALGGTECPTTP